MPQPFVQTCLQFKLSFWRVQHAGDGMNQGDIKGKVAEPYFEL